MQTSGTGPGRSGRLVVVLIIALAVAVFAISLAVVLQRDA